MNKNLLLGFIFSFVYFLGYSQDFSNKGKEFWLAYSYHVGMINSAQGLPTMTLYLTSDVTTTYNVEIFGGVTIQAGSINANQVVSVIIPTAYFISTNGISLNKTIHVTSLKAIVVYSFITRSQASAASLCLPANVLGKEYYATSFTQNSNEQNSNSYITIVAIDDNTVVDITVTAPTTGGWAAGSTNTISLNKGQIYQVLGTTTGNNGVDLSGSKIKSIASGTFGCKRIAVFSGSGKVSIGAPAITPAPACTGGSADNLYQQLIPVASWGKNFLTVPSFGKPYNYYRVMRSDPATNLYVNGILIPSTSFTNNYYQFFNRTPNYIVADQPISVAQYFTSQQCPGSTAPGGGNPTPYDPDMIIISPIEQIISDVTLVSSPLTVGGAHQHNLHIIMKNGGTAQSTFKFDLTNVPITSWVTHPANPAYSYLYLSNITAGNHTLVSDSGFNAIAYGYGNAETYGYNAGTNVRDFNINYIAYSPNASPLELTPSVCTGSPFRFKMSLPFQPLQLTWGLNAVGALPASALPNNTPVIQVTDLSCSPPPSPSPLPNYPTAGFVCHDSVTVFNGKPLFWYSLPLSYTVNTAGQYNVPITAQTSNVDGCGTSRDFEFPLGVYDPPLADFTNNQPGCLNDPVQFTDITVTIKPNYKWNWNFGDPASGAANTSTAENPIHVFVGPSTNANPNTFTVTLTTLTTVGCFSTTATKNIYVPILVNATITGTTALCQNAPQPSINFTITDGLPPYKINYTLSVNGGAAVTQTPIITSTLLNPFSVATTTAGIYTYNITSIENANAAFCTRPITGQTATVTVNPLPTATISGTTTVCQNTTAPNITFTGAGGTAPYTFNYTLNSVAQTVTTTSGNSVTVAASTATIGTFNYVLVSVTDASSTLCTNTATGTATVNVQATSTATISGAATVCQNATAPVITFTAANGNAPFTFEYNINGGATQTISTIATSNSVSLTVPMIAAGTFIYNLTSVQNTGSITCLTPITGASTTIVINAVPTAIINGSTTVCQNTSSPDITFTGSNALAPYTFAYNINGGPTQTVTTTTGNSVTVIAPTNITGTFIYTLLSVTDASSTMCTETYTTANTATIVVQATSTATITGNATVCQNEAAPLITFTGSNGNSPFTFTYNINGGTTQTISTIATSNSVTVPVSMAVAGTFVYNLLSVKNTGPILCLTPITASSVTVVINPVPAATIAGTTTICQNSASPNITFTGANATAPYTFTYTINGGAPLTITTITGNSVTVTVPTSTPGNYVYELLQVQDASSTQCIKTYTNITATVTIKQLASATISTSAATVCQASASPIITFTAAGGEAPYTFAYTINGTPATISTIVGNSVTLPVSTTTVGTFIFTLTSVTESSTGACVQNQTSSTQVIVYPKPTASFTTTGPYCQQKAITFTPTFGITPTGNITQWVWDFGDGTGPQIITDGTPFTVTYPTVGPKNVTFKTVSNNGCESNISNATITINVKPKAGFINPESCLADVFANFTDTSKPLGTIALWEWNFGDIGSPTNIVTGSTPAEQNPQHAYATTGPKSVKLQVTTTSGCKADTTQAFFINGVVTSTDFIAQNPPQFCSNRPVNIKENSVVAVGALIRVDIYWDFAAAPTVFEQDDLPVFGKIYSHNYPILLTDKIYTIRYRAYTGFDVSCFKTIDKDILVKGSPVALFDPIPPVCLNGGPVTLTQGSGSGTAVGPGTYLGTGVTQTSPGVFVFNPLAANVLPGGTYTISYSATSSASCDSTTTQQITVLRPPVVNTFTTVGNLCHNNAITFNNTYTNGDGIVIKWIYNWNDASSIQTMTTGADITHIYTTTGPHFATLTLETDYPCKTLPRRVDFTVNPLPVPSYNPSPSVCLPSADVLFTNTTQNIGSNTYQWSFDLPSTTAANTSTLTSPNHIYTTQGPFNTHLIATNITTGCKDSTAVIVINSGTIHPAPVLQFNNIPDVCLNNGTVSFAGLASETSGIAGGPGIFTCVLTPAAISANGIFNPAIAGVGLHNITYSWTSSFNCPSSINKTVKVLASPVVNTFVTIGNTCENNSITFRNTVTQGDGVINKWVYDWGDNSPVEIVTNGNNVTHTYLVPNTYTATLYVITDGLCKSAPPLSLQVVVNPLPRPDFTYTDTTCLPQAKVTFINKTPNIGNWAYNWNLDFPSTLPADQSTQVTNVPYTYTSLTPAHSVKLTATSSTTFCTLSKIKIINGIHPAPVASFNFNKPSVCIGDNIRVTHNSTSAEGSLSTWLWNYGEIPSNASGQVQPPYTYNTAGTFNVKLTVTSSFGCTDDSIRAFSVYPFPVVNAGLDDFVLEGESIILKGTATGNNLTYLWTSNPSPSYLNVNNTLNPIATPKVDVTYKLTATALLGGCTKEDFVFIEVLKLPEIPNTFTPNSDGIHDFWEIKYLNTYPGNRVQIFTRTGQLVFESRGYTSPWDGNKNGKSLPFDTYYYIIEPGKGRQPITGFVTIVK